MGGKKWNCHHFIISNDIASGIHFIYNSLYGILDGTTFISTNNFVVIVLRDNYCHKDSFFFFSLYLHFESYYISKGTYHCQEQKKCQNNALNLHFFSLQTDAFFSIAYSLLLLIPWAEKKYFLFHYSMFHSCYSSKRVIYAHGFCS